MKHDRQPIDLMYVEGAGNTVESLRRWLSGEDVISESSKTFSGQVFDFCKKNNLSALAVSSMAGFPDVGNDKFSSIAIHKKNYSGRLGYHFSQILHGLKVLFAAARYRPKYLHITSGTTHLFILAPLKLLNIKIFPHFHNAFWPRGFPSRTVTSKLLNRLDGWFLSNIASGALCCSNEVKRQIQVISNPSCPVFIFKCQFNEKSFQYPASMSQEQKQPFVVMYAGRIEREKGVFDFIEVADRLRNESVLFHLCGDGSALVEVERERVKRKLESTVKIHGRLNRNSLIDIYTLSHVVLVPTTKDFPEGFAMVAVEAVLLGKPVVASSVVPAVEALMDAAIEVRAGDVDGYVSVIRKLMTDANLYKKMQDACMPLRNQFINGDGGLTNVLDQTLHD